MIYFIQAGDDGPVKIGFSGSIEQRFRKMRTDCPVPPRMLGTMIGSKSVERELHEKFSVLRLHGEWFAASHELLTFIGTLPKYVTEKEMKRRRLGLGRPKNLYVYQRDQGTDRFFKGPIRTGVNYLVRRSESHEISQWLQRAQARLEVEDPDDWPDWWPYGRKDWTGAVEPSNSSLPIAPTEPERGVA